METIEKITPEKSLEMKDACIERAKNFALEDFALRMQNYFLPDEVNETLQPPEGDSEKIEVSKKEFPPQEKEEKDITIDLLAVDGIKPTS